jgi:glyoxylase-like metal-dependent hydrolase (beta-lactamase superfamily II)
MKKVKLYLNYAGHCLAKENDAIQGGRKQKIAFQALWGIIVHPKKGLILYDTGYTNRFFEETKYYPNRIYAKITQVTIKKEDEVKSQLERHKIKAEDIQHIIITHFHADHVGGLKDFPNAKIYCVKAALRQAIKIPKFKAFSKGILKGLLPDDLEKRVVLIDENCTTIQDDILGVKYDLFGDNSIYAVPLPGHAAGQIGILLETEKKPYFLIADAVWLKKSYEEFILPNSIVKLFIHSWSDFKTSLKKVHKFHQKHPETIVVPTHCEETTDLLINKIIDFVAL